MTTPTTPEQARDFAQSMWDAGAADDEVAMMRGLADQIEALTFANRDLINWYEALKFDYEALKTDAGLWRAGQHTGQSQSTDDELRRNYQED